MRSIEGFRHCAYLGPKAEPLRQRAHLVWRPPNADRGVGNVLDAGLVAIAEEVVQFALVGKIAEKQSADIGNALPQRCKEAHRFLPRQVLPRAVTNGLAESLRLRAGLYEVDGVVEEK